MFSHVMIGSNDIEKSKRFYDAVLGLLGAGEPFRMVAPGGQVRLYYRHAGNTFCVGEPQVREFHDTAVALGGLSAEEPPGLRDGALGARYLAFVRDPDGNKLCALHWVKGAT
jgi:catechol 2,3-dioxygenase-like lactoylglutathione lyase family enzyme